MMTFIVMSAVVFPWILAEVYGSVPGSAAVNITTSGFQAAFFTIEL